MSAVVLGLLLAPFLVSGAIVLVIVTHAVITRLSELRQPFVIWEDCPTCQESRTLPEENPCSRCLGMGVLPFASC